MEGVTDRHLNVDWVRNTPIFRHTGIYLYLYGPVRAYGVVVSMFDFHRSDRGSNPGRGGKIS